jgi:hypothetical protein
MRNLRAKILSRIRAEGRGGVYISKDFLDLGSRAAIDQTLSRLVKDGSIRRLERGLFHYPRVNPRLGVVLSPDANHVAQAVARKRGGMVLPSGASAASSLGLTTQVPGRQVFITNAASGVIRLGKQTLTLKHVSPKKMGSRDKSAAAVLQALQHIGKGNIDDAVVQRLRSMLTDRDKKTLLKESRYAVGWVADAVKKVVLEKE